MTVKKTQFAPGRYLIQHPDTPMSNEQRAWEMWAVHPSDLDRLGFTCREDFYLAHINAAARLKEEE